jgi:hypothetical protein
MGVCSDQPLAQGKGVHREVESEGSQRQNSGPRNTNNIRRETWVETAIQVKAQKLHGYVSVNVAGIWKESESSYRVRPHGQVETE